MSAIILIIISIFYSTNLYALDKIKISKTTYDRMLNYLKGDFYSVEHGNRIFGVAGMYFIVSADGNYSVISYCPEDDTNKCSPNHAEFKANYRCKKISKQNCTTLFVSDNLVTRKDTKKIKITENTNLLNLFEINLVTTEDQKKISDIAALSYEEKSSGQDSID